VQELAQLVHVFEHAGLQSVSFSSKQGSGLHDWMNCSSHESGFRCSSLDRSRSLGLQRQSIASRSTTSGSLHDVAFGTSGCVGTFAGVTGFDLLVEAAATLGTWKVSGAVLGGGVAQAARSTAAVDGRRRTTASYRSR